MNATLKLGSHIFLGIKAAQEIRTWGESITAISAVYVGGKIINIRFNIADTNALTIIKELDIVNKLTSIAIKALESESRFDSEGYYGEILKKFGSFFYIIDYNSVPTRLRLTFGLSNYDPRILKEGFQKMILRHGILSYNISDHFLYVTTLFKTMADIQELWIDLAAFAVLEQAVLIEKFTEPAVFIFNSLGEA